MIRRLLPLLLLGLAAVSTPARAEVRGWRGSNHGRFEVESAPLVWSDAKNVKWSTATPARGNSSPVLVGGLLLITAEPNLLLAYDPATGAERWRQVVTVGDPAAVAEAQEKAAALGAERSALQSELNVLRRQARQRGKREAARARRKVVLEALAVVDEGLAALESLVPPPGHPVIGYASSTPVFDGERLYVAFGTGVVAAYRLDGERVWAQKAGPPHTPMRGTSEGHAASLILSGGRLIVAMGALTGLDPKTGKTIWRGPVYGDFGTPASVQVGKTAVVLTPDGYAVRARDGKILAEGLGDLWYIGPVVEGGVAYYAGGGDEQTVLSRGYGLVLAVAFSEDGKGGLKTREQWRARLRSDLIYAHPVVHEGILYVLTREAWLHAIALDTGKVLYQSRLEGGAGPTYPSLAIAGDRLYASFERGTTIVLAPGPTFRQLQVNQLEPMMATPVFDGRRVYLRTLEHLFAIGE